MIRKYNYTGKVNFNRNVIEVKLQDDNKNFEVKLNNDDLKKNKFPSESSIILEVYNRYKNKRFSLGTIGKPHITTRFSLDEFSGYDKKTLRLRLKIIAADNSGLLLGKIQNLKFVNHENCESGSISILPLKREDLDKMIWDLDTNEENDVYLVENINLTNSNFIQDFNRFGSLVFPEIVRRILTDILIIDHAKWENASDTTYWQVKWLLFAKTLNEKEIPKEAGPDENKEQKKEWILECVNSFTNQLELVDKINDFFEDKES